MNFLCHRIAAVVGLGLLSAGCTMGSLVDDEPATAPPLRTLEGPTGTGGHNGLKPSITHPRIAQLDALMQQPMLVNGMWNPNFNSFISNPEGREVFRYAAECALPLGTTVENFVGAGLMATGEDWMTYGLSLKQRNDIHTCIATRLNPTAIWVPIWIGGPNTTKTEGSDHYEYFEALWTVTMSGGAWEAYVWPSDTYENSPACKDVPKTISAEAQTRVCENDSTLCHLNVRYDLATACQGTPGGGDWICNGQPAIETRLTATGWNEMHPDCTIP